jgi:hypothetical protein
MLKASASSYAAFAKDLFDLVLVFFFYLDSRRLGIVR